MGLEEALLLPVMAAEGPQRARQAQRIRREHWAIRRQIERFNVAIQEREQCADDVCAFVEALRRHAAFEDESLYAWTDGVDSPEAARQSLYAPMQAAV